ncbi:MAG: hypothetical protein ACE5Q3_01745 [Alphaproteobacteria bacterium]
MSAPRGGSASRAGTRREASGGRVVGYGLLCVAALTLVFAPPIFIVAVAGMAPTAAAYVTDREPGRYAVISVGAMNFVGVAPFLGEAWAGTRTFHAAFALLSDPLTWLTMYGAAALGWALLAVMPCVAAAYLRIALEARRQRLLGRQAALVDEWGRGVASREDGNVR